MRKKDLLSDPEMASSGSGAVFFLGTRAHYQVLQQPGSRFDVENGNASTETIYQNPSVQELWPADQATQEVKNKGYANDRWGYCDQGDGNVGDEKDKTDCSTVKRRSRRRPSETTLCERDTDMKPALLNTLGDSSTLKTKSRGRVSLLTFLASLARRKRRLDANMQYLHHIESALNSCTYRESCRCLDCQSRYFECDDSDEYSSEDSEYAPRYVAHVDEPESEPPRDEEDDDEVFIDTVPGDNTSTDILLETKEKMSVSSDEALEAATTEEDNLNLEVAAGTPVLLNYLLTHPITCAIQ